MRELGEHVLPRQVELKQPFVEDWPCPDPWAVRLR